MTRFGLLGTSALRSAAFAGFTLIMTSTALAQEVPADPSAPADAAQPPTQTAAAQPPQAAPVAEAPDDEGAIVVTGSRIRRPNLESTIPITSIGGNEFFETGRTSVGDVLNELPSLRSTFSQSNSTQFLGTAGLNLLDLRGLGTQRTLVLQNGRRHVAGDILNNAVSPDTNAIPVDLIDRVEVVTGGNSAIYGSDAIAGVVNFVLKEDYEGVQLRGQGGISKYGDAGSYYASALAGTNFADGRGNIAINVEYARQNDFYASRRPNLRNNQGFVVVDSDPPGTPNGSDGVPDRQFFTDIRSRIFSNQGTFLISDPASDFFTPYIFQPDGTLLQQTGDVVGLPPFGSAIGGSGSNFREGTQFGLSPKLDRYSVNLLGHFTISDAFVPFIEAKYVRTDSLGNASGPFFFSGGTTGSPREFFFTDNPFLNPQAAEFIRDYYGVGPGTNAPFFMTRNVVELSNREEKAKRETYRIVGGVRGTFNDDWNYEVSANYGEFKEKTRILGNVNLQRFLLAIDAVRDPATGNIVCRASIDPAARIALEVAADPAFAAAQLADDVTACVPVNMFGEGNISDAARDYLLQDSFARGKITQLVLNGFVSGDSSQLFELPGGPSVSRSAPNIAAKPPSTTRTISARRASPSTTPSRPSIPPRSR